MTSMKINLDDGPQSRSNWREGTSSDVSMRMGRGRTLNPPRKNWLGGTVQDITAFVTIDKPHSRIGRGGFCEVYLGRDSHYGRVALKRPLVDPKDYSTESLKAIRNEIEICVRAKHKHILEFLGTCFIDEHVHLVSPYVANGNLTEYVKLNPNVDRVRILAETVAALAYLHSIGIVHGDIKASNILVGIYEEAKICDFGLSKLLPARTLTMLKGAGTLCWQAPELFHGQPKTRETDVYAYGITIAEVIAGSTPFSGQNGATILNSVLCGERPLKEPAASPFGDSYALIWDVAQRCWCQSPAERITMDEALTELQARPCTTKSPQPPIQPSNKSEGPVQRVSVSNPLSSPPVAPIGTLDETHEVDGSREPTLYYRSGQELSHPANPPNPMVWPAGPRAQTPWFATGRPQGNFAFNSSIQEPRNLQPDLAGPSFEMDPRGSNLPLQPQPASSGRCQVRPKRRIRDHMAGVLTCGLFGQK